MTSGLLSVLALERGVITSHQNQQAGRHAGTQDGTSNVSLRRVRPAMNRGLKGVTGAAAEFRPLSLGYPGDHHRVLTSLSTCIIQI